ncbi:MAG: hypothetical protein COB04_19485 [Gammaproteobacteria bacterium]|nr:MAG: hypothetical protein COB04_19485 [Gammaproteobacteria bacterium]
MFSLIFILAGLAASWRYCDISSDSFIAGTLAPGSLTLFIIALMCWLVVYAGMDGRTDRRMY